MTTISIIPEPSEASAPCFRAIAGGVQSSGASAGQALDALTAQLGGPGGITLVVVQPMEPDAWFPAAQRQRLQELMARWRTARDRGAALAPEEEAELTALVEAELRAAAARSDELARKLAP